MDPNTEVSNENVRFKRSNKPGGDLHPAISSELFWDEEHRRQSLDVVFKRAEDHALNAINWYLHAKRSKKKLCPISSNWHDWVICNCRSFATIEPDIPESVVFLVSRMDYSSTWHSRGINGHRQIFWLF